MKRELVTGLLTLSLLASMLPANAQAAEGMFGASAAGQVQTMTEGAGEDGVQTENTADIDGTQYATLAEAVAQAEEGATIRLLRDVELDASGLVNGQGALTLSKDLTLDGSGHTIRAKAGTFSVSGDNGTGPSLLNLQDGAEVTLRDVTFDGGSAAKHGLNIYHAGMVTLENVEIDQRAGCCVRPALFRSRQGGPLGSGMGRHTPKSKRAAHPETDAPHLFCIAHAPANCAGSRRASAVSWGTSAVNVSRPPSPSTPTKLPTPSRVSDRTSVVTALLPCRTWVRKTSRYSRSASGSSPAWRVVSCQ